MRTVAPGNDNACSLKTVPTIRNPGLSFVFVEQGPGACAGLAAVPEFVPAFVPALVLGFVELAGGVVCCAAVFLAEQDIKTVSNTIETLMKFG
jgi:hypothetical protein